MTRVFSVSFFYERSYSSLLSPMCAMINIQAADGFLCARSCAALRGVVDELAADACGVDTVDGCADFQVVDHC